VGLHSIFFLMPHPTPDPEFRRILAEHGMRIVTGCAEKLGEEELRELRARLAALRSFTPISQP
jgi:hypothetical protein